MKDKQVVIITGMPRSGTSLLSSILQEAGVQIGDHLVEPSRGNEYGHFEDVDFFRFHEDVLHRLGHTVFIQNCLDLESILPEETDRAKGLIERRQHQSLWGWKDPRTTLFLEFWHHLIPHARYVFVYRHPLEVVLSILRRGIDPDILTNPFAGLKSWEIYNQAILDFYTRHSERCMLAHIRTVTADVQEFISFTTDKLKLPLRKKDTQQIFRPAALKPVQSIQAAFPLLSQVRSEAVEIYKRLEAQADLPENIVPKYGSPPSSSSTHHSQSLVSEKFKNISGAEQAVDKFLLLLVLLDSQTLLDSRRHLDNFRTGWMTYGQNLKTHAENLEKFITDLRNERDAFETRLAAIENTRIWRVAKKWYNLKSLSVRKAKAISQQVLPPRFRLWAKFQYQSAQIWRKSRHQQQFLPPHSKPKTLKGLNPLMVYPEMGAPTRYRVFNQAAQMELLDLHPMRHQNDELEALDQLSQADLLYLYRVEATPLIKSLVKGAKQRRIPVIFDTDDLIWDQRIESYCFLRDHWPDREVDDFLISVKRHEAIMEQVDYFVASTPFLAKLAETHFGKEAFVNKNAIDQTAQTISQPFYQARQNRGIPHTAAMVTIVYASGWFRAHQEDFEVAVEALRQVLRDRPQVRLKIIGYLELDGLFTGYEERIEFQKFVDWKKLLEVLSKIDINLAPIVKNPQRRSKSAVKFLESALVGVPTVASNLEPYHDIDHGRTGFLAGSTAEWYDCLIQLIDSPELRYQMGQAAHEKVLACDTVQVRATHLEKTLHQIIEDYYDGA